MGNKVLDARWERWHTCGLCEQKYHGVVRCALGWACWKTYVGRPEMDVIRGMALNQLANGLSEACQDEEALSVKQVELSTLRRLGDSEHNILVVQGNLSGTYQGLGRLEEAREMKQAVYLGHLRLNGEEHEGTLLEASNYADTLMHLNHFDEAKLLLRKMMPVARRVFGDGNEITLRMRWCYAGRSTATPAPRLAISARP